MEATSNTTEALLTLTESAAKEIGRLIASDSESPEGVRLAVSGGGCSGLSYALDFDSEREGDHVIEKDGVKCFVDPKSAVYLKGITLDFRDGLQGKGFVFNNPNAVRTCGCGESFSV